MLKTKHQKHTPIVSKAQRGMMGAELARRQRGEKGQMPRMSIPLLESHLRESAGKKLPKRTQKRTGNPWIRKGNMR